MRKAAILYCIGLTVAMFIPHLPLITRLFAPMPLVAFGLPVWMGLEKMSDKVAEHVRPLTEEEKKELFEDDSYPHDYDDPLWDSISNVWR